MSDRPDAPPCAAPDFQPRAPREALPAESCDCHAHILGPAALHPYAEIRVYTPPNCLRPDYEKMLATLGVSRSVLVQPSVYGTDNTVLVDAIKSNPKRYRGVAVVPADVSADELNRLNEIGIRGVRVNVVDIPDRQAGTLPMAHIRALAAKIAPLGWHIELLLHVNEFPDLDRQLTGLGVDLVFGHFGYSPTSLGVEAPGYQALLRMLRQGDTWVKLTAPYRISKHAPLYGEVSEWVDRLIDANLDRLMWGSDWPHVRVAAPMPNDGDLVDAVCAWIADPAARERIFATNAAELYRFD